MDVSNKKYINIKNNNNLQFFRKLQLISHSVAINSAERRRRKTLDISIDSINGQMSLGLSNNSYGGNKNYKRVKFQDEVEINIIPNRSDYENLYDNLWNNKYDYNKYFNEYKADIDYIVSKFKNISTLQAIILLNQPQFHYIIEDINRC
uniref:Uncharacterized protein n=1 Tax=Chromulina nebulosa TaxID=96789 RepID=A0A7S0SSX1_9STRA|mmetsp:Transcript_1058/g.927  ORF Transcript_1058/g.927 Transcript_1058/m.927 type:complete len:149 (+) Transcript_1058:148-594(+)